MRRELLLTSDPIDEPALTRNRARSETMGARLCFAGVVRNLEDSSPISAIRYEAFHEMAEHQFKLLFDHIEKTWPIDSIRLIHRVGVVAAGETSLWVEVVAPHRGEAFAACQYLIDRMKERVPIWKHPVAPTPPAAPPAAP